MYIEPELQIIKFTDTEVTTIEVSEGHTPGIGGGDIGYDELQ